MAGGEKPVGNPGAKLRTAQVDSVRALAALSVLTFHAAAWGGAFIPGHRMGTLIWPAESSVTVLLVITGFLLYRPFVRAHVEGGRTVATWPYAARRFMRMVPAYWAALVVCALVLSWSYVFTWDGVLKFFTLQQTYFSVPVSVAAIAPAWTLGLETSFYIFLPIWAWLMRKLHPDTGRGALLFHWKGVAFLAACGIAYKIILVNFGNFDGITVSSYAAFATLPAYIDAFAIGMALALIMAGEQTKTAARPRIATLITERPWVAWAAVGVALVITALYVKPDTANSLYNHKEYAVRMVLYPIIAFGLVGPAALGMTKKSAINSFLSWRPLVSIGLVSYGIYLWHWGVILWLSAHFPDVSFNPYFIWLTVPLAITLVIATLSYVLIERPSMVLSRRAGGAYRDEVSPPPPVPLGEEGLHPAASPADPATDAGPA